MNEPLPPDIGSDRAPPEDDGLWSEALSALGLLGAVILLVLVISLVGRL
jgi:hypothetical protein